MGVECDVQPGLAICKGCHCNCLALDDTADMFYAGSWLCVIACGQGTERCHDCHVIMGTCRIGHQTAGCRALLMSTTTYLPPSCFLRGPRLVAFPADPDPPLLPSVDARCCRVLR